MSNVEGKRGADYQVNPQEHLYNTVANLREAEDYLEEHEGKMTADQKEAIVSKNNRREESINGLMQGIREESQ